VQRAEGGVDADAAAEEGDGSFHCSSQPLAPASSYFPRTGVCTAGTYLHSGVCGAFCLALLVVFLSHSSSLTPCLDTILIARV
jgi:hypothetical protein